MTDYITVALVSLSHATTEPILLGILIGMTVGGLVGLGMLSGWLLFHLIRFIRRND